MQFEDRENQDLRNERPKEPNRNLPAAVLLVLLGIICALLYIGWKYMSDDSSGNNDELTAVPADTIVKTIRKQSDEEKNLSETSNVASDTSDLPEVSVPRLSENTKIKAEKKEKQIAEIPSRGENYTHIVGEGETFFGIANRYNIKKETLSSMNPNIDESGIKVGITKLKIRIKAIHTVGPGDIIKVVSKKYNVSQALIMQANKKNKNIATRGEKLVIPFAEKQ